MISSAQKTNSQKIMHHLMPDSNKYRAPMVGSENGLKYSKILILQKTFGNRGSANLVQTASKIDQTDNGLIPLVGGRARRMISCDKESYAKPLSREFLPALQKIGILRKATSNLPVDPMIGLSISSDSEDMLRRKTQDIDINGINEIIFFLERNINESGRPKEKSIHKIKINNPLFPDIIKSKIATKNRKMGQKNPKINSMMRNYEFQEDCAFDKNYESNNFSIIVQKNSERKRRDAILKNNDMPFNDYGYTGQLPQISIPSFSGKSFKQKSRTNSSDRSYKSFIPTTKIIEKRESSKYKDKTLDVVHFNELIKRPRSILNVRKANLVYPKLSIDGSIKLIEFSSKIFNLINDYNKITANDPGYLFQLTLLDDILKRCMELKLHLNNQKSLQEKLSNLIGNVDNEIRVVRTQFSNLINGIDDVPAESLNRNLPRNKSETPVSRKGPYLSHKSKLFAELAKNIKQAFGSYNKRKKTERVSRCCEKYLVASYDLKKIQNSYIL